MHDSLTLIFHTSCWFQLGVLPQKAKQILALGKLKHMICGCIAFLWAFLVGFFFPTNYSVIQDSVLNVSYRVSGCREVHCQLLDCCFVLPVRIQRYITISFSLWTQLNYLQIILYIWYCSAILCTIYKELQNWQVTNTDNFMLFLFVRLLRTKEKSQTLNPIILVFSFVS